MDATNLIRRIEKIQATMIAVATGGPRIETQNHEFIDVCREVERELSRRGMTQRLPFTDLWDWYGRWSSGDLPSYQSRRVLVRESLAPILNALLNREARTTEPTGWMRVDRTIGRCRDHLAAARSEEDYQSVGLLCREALISLAQAVWRSERHPPLDGVVPSETDAKRRLEAFIVVELATGPNEQARKHVRSALDLAVSLQHKRTAGFRDAALCLEATTSVVNVVAIVEGRRDPVQPASPSQ